MEDVKPWLDVVNKQGMKLADLLPGDAGLRVEDNMEKDNKRFKAICEAVQKRADKLQMTRSKSMEVRIIVCSTWREWFVIYQKYIVCFILGGQAWVVKNRV